jgi:hypothetical protein
MYFGDSENADYRARLPNLSPKQLDALEPFVKFKMRPEKEKKLVQWSDKDAKAELCKVMVEMNVGEGARRLSKRN